MAKIFCGFIFLAGFWASLGNAASTEASFHKIGSAMEGKIAKSGIPKSEFTMYVTVGDESPQSVLDVNSEHLMIPASVTKLTTASAVLDSFPPGTKFKTTLWFDKFPDGVVAKGPLYLKGGGDPGFVSENMWFLVNHFVRNGVSKIEGDIVVDDSLFDQTRFDESREDVRVDRAYDAPVGAMSFNWNSINIFVRPGKKGESANVFLDPENGYTRLVNKTKTNSGAGSTISVERDGSQAGDTLVVSGSIGTEKNEVVVYKNITHPDLWAGENLKSFLAQRGIVVTGKVRSGLVPADAVIVAESESKPIEQLLADMNKFSNNFVAEMLTKNLGRKTTGPATLADGVRKINDHLRGLGLSDKEFVIKNPSGLTRENRLSAKSLWKVVHHLRNDFRVQPELLASLPIAGIDGTLKKRMKSGPAERWVRAKTGFLSGVAALAGYAGRKDGTVFTFVFIHNGARDESRIRALFDDCLVTLVE